MGRPSKNPLRPAPGSIALISPQQYLALSSLGPPTLITRILKWLPVRKKGTPAIDRDTMKALWVGNASPLSMRKFVNAVCPKLSDDVPDWFAELERAVATPDAFKAFSTPVTGPQALDGWLEIIDWRVFREHWLPKPDLARGRNADFFASHLLPMQEASFTASRLARDGMYPAALEVLAASWLGSYVDWEPLRAKIHTVKNAGDFANRIAAARLLSILFVLAVLEHELPYKPDPTASFLDRLMAFQRDDGQFDTPFARLLSLSKSVVGDAGAKKLLALENPESRRKRESRWRKKSMDWSMPSHHTLVQLWREVAEIRGVERPDNLHDSSEDLFRDLHLLTELGGIVAGWPHSLHPDGFNGFFGLYRTMYDDMAAAPRTKAPPPGG